MDPEDAIQDLVDDGIVDQSVVDEITGDFEGEEDGVRTLHGHLVVNEDGERLAFANTKSGSDAIHIAAREPKEPTRGKLRGLGSSYRWSVCGFGASHKDTDNPLYLDTDELEDEYIVRDGEVVGKLCGNCRQQK